MPLFYKYNEPTVTNQMKTNRRTTIYKEQTNISE